MTRGGALAAALAVALAVGALVPAPSSTAQAADPDAPVAGSPATGGDPGVVVSAFVEGPSGPSIERHEVADAAEARALVAELEARGDVTAADVAAEVRSHTGDPKRDTQWGLDALRAEEAWELATAGGTTIAVLDSGVDGSHPDLVGVLGDGYDALDADGDGTADTSERGHGTRVAGVAGAEVGNDIGIAGMAPGAELLPVRVLDDFGEGDGASIADGVLWAAGQGADVINLSLGGVGRDEVLSLAIEHARRQGSLVVASSGNSAERGNPVVYPAAEPSTVAVGAVGQDLERAVFSSYGDWLDLVAPGTAITTTCPIGLTERCTDGYHLFSSGTSFAAPFVSGTAALLAARHPRALPSQLAWRLSASAAELAAAEEEVGAGLVDPVEALRAAPELGCRSEDPGTVVRAYDVGRVETAVAVGCSHWPQGTTREVVLATARDFPDALAGAALAARRRAPLLLTERRRVPAHLEEVLVDLGVERVHLLGGEAAIEAPVADVLEERGLDVDRLAGDDRYATAAAIARRAARRDVEEVVLVSGEGFADAVAAGTFQGAWPGTPVLLTRADRLPEATAEALVDLEPDRVFVIGGEQAIAESVAEEVRALVPRLSRIAGADRYATSALLAGGLGVEGPLLVASGRDYPDALAAGALAARLRGRLLLVPPERLGSDDPAVGVVRNAGWERAEIIGGPAAVSDTVRDALRTLLE